MPRARWPDLRNVRDEHGLDVEVDKEEKPDIMEPVSDVGERG